MGKNHRQELVRKVAREFIRENGLEGQVKNSASAAYSEWKRLAWKKIKEMQITTLGVLASVKLGIRKGVTGRSVDHQIDDFATIRFCPDELADGMTYLRELATMSLIEQVWLISVDGKMNYRHI